MSTKSSNNVKLESNFCTKSILKRINNRINDSIDWEERMKNVNYKLDAKISEMVQKVYESRCPNFKKMFIHELILLYEEKKIIQQYRVGNLIKKIFEK